MLLLLQLPRFLSSPQIVVIVVVADNDSNHDDTIDAIHKRQMYVIVSAVHFDIKIFIF